LNAKADPAARRAAIAEGQPEPVGLLGWVLIALRVAAVVLTLVLLVPLHYIYRTIHYGSPFPQLFLWLTARIVGARVVRHGVPLKRDVFLISNHLSWVDILAIAGASGTAFVAKGEAANVPVIGWLCRINRTVFVSRENRTGVAKQINSLREALADNWSVTVFPEGTTTDGQSLLPFKTSLLRVLEPPPPGVLVQPIMLDYGPHAEWIGWIGVEGGIDNAFRVLKRWGRFTLHLHFLDPFDPAPHPGRKAIAAESRRRIEAALTDALGKPLRTFAYDVGAIGFSARKAEGLDSSAEPL
jgi:lyso-ornithine lipid O-acyltransferase